MRARSILLAGLAILASLRATTLQKLSLDDMIQQSTGIVRARVVGSHAALRGSNVYTFYQLQVLEVAKAAHPAKEIEVAVPGGTAGGIRQLAIGSPELTTGSEYVVFLWTGKSGLTQIIGLSQGLFQVEKDASGKVRLTRPAPEEPMLDQNGKAVDSQPIGNLAWSELRTRIQRELGK